MEWSDIRIFLEVVRKGTMIGATAVLRMDHSTISRRIARLEQETGVQIFERAGRRLALTAEGAKLVAAAHKLESIILQDILSLSEEQDRIAGVVRIGTTEAFGAHYLAPRLANLTAEHTGLEIELVALPRSFSLATREVDILITLDRPITGDVRYKKLVDMEFGVFGSAAYFDGRQRPARLTQLAGETWCGSIAELQGTPEQNLIPCVADATSVPYRTTSTTVQLGAALGGYALASLPCFIGSAHSALERLLPAEAICERTYWMAVHDDLANYPRVRAVMSAIEIQVAQDRSLLRPSAATGVNVIAVAADRRAVVRSEPRRRVWPDHDGLRAVGHA